MIQSKVASFVLFLSKTRAAIFFSKNKTKKNQSQLLMWPFFRGRFLNFEFGGVRLSCALEMRQRVEFLMMPKASS